MTWMVPYLVLCQTCLQESCGFGQEGFPSRVVDLQEQWGDYLVSQKQVDMAINHYIEAVIPKAIEAALAARQYSRALQLVDVLGGDISRPYYKQLARYYEESCQYDG